jgi:hypothetical protein
MPHCQVFWENFIPGRVGFTCSVGDGTVSRFFMDLQLFAVIILFLRQKVVEGFSMETSK